MSKFWQKKYISKHTGAEIDEAVEAVLDGDVGTKVVANPTLAGTEAALTGLQVGDDKYAVGGMTNPMTAAGDMIVGGTNGAPEKLVKGTDGKVLKMVSGAPAWADDASGMTNPMTAAGDIIVGGADGTPTRLAGFQANYPRFLKCRQNSLAWNNISYDDLYVSSSNSLGKVIVCGSNTEGYNYALGRIGSDYGLGVLTTAPSADNTDGIKIVVLSSEPATKYNGYLYIITA